MKVSIHYKITFVFGAIIAVVFFGVYIYLNNNLREDTYQRIRTNLLKQASLTKFFFEEDPAGAVRHQGIDETADKIGKELSARVTVIGSDGTVLGDSSLDEGALGSAENHLFRPEVQQALLTGTGESRRFSTTLKKDMLYIARGFGEGKTRGIIRLSMPLSEIELISSRLKKLLIASFLPAFLLAVIISFAASAFITKPIKKMSSLAQAIAGGDFSERVLISTKDEMGDLAKTFNYMSEQIRFRIEEVTLSRSRFEAVLLSMFEGVMVVDIKGAILLMNQALKDFLLVKEEPHGKKPLEVVRNIEIQEIIDKVLKIKQGVESREISLLLPEEKTLLLHAAPVVREGATEGAVLVFHDITNLRRLEKMRQDFVANVSHELRTPIASIKGYAETLIEGALDDKENARDFLKIIYSDSDRLAKLIDDILDLSRVESGRLKMTLTPSAVKPIIERVVAGLKKQAQDKSVKIKIDIPQDIPRVLADENRVAQVLLNLIDNAIKYTESKGEVIISADEQGEFVRIDVSDTGIGIPENDLPRLFERFYRVDKARSRELGGTGLGLSIVKHIVQAHNGQVSVQSVLGQGSAFSFTIPKA
ncbi:MAG: HAMP domain-containing protein [Candidatus Omnitrophica bacterium]|nr:HAMP domain-containing protein [Candidatus Omnitrophota bacterium]